MHLADEVPSEPLWRSLCSSSAAQGVLRPFLTILQPPAIIIEIVVAQNQCVYALKEQWGVIVFGTEYIRLPDAKDHTGHLAPGLTVGEKHQSEDANMSIDVYYCRICGLCT